MKWHVPTLADVLEARRRISPHLRPTPLFAYASLNELLDAEVFVKHENHQPVGAFKVRGGVNLISQLGAEERERGVIAASTGNHGQSIAYAARLFGVTATICVPEIANPVKVASMRGLGAELVFHGRDYDDAREHCERLARERGLRYVHSGNEPLLIAEIGPVRATVITYVNPAVAAILGVVVLSEELTVGMGVGFVLVLAGSVLATRPVAPRAAARQPTLEPAATDG